MTCTTGTAASHEDGNVFLDFHFDHFHLRAFISLLHNRSLRFLTLFGFHCYVFFACKRPKQAMNKKRAWALLLFITFMRLSTAHLG